MTITELTTIGDIAAAVQSSVRVFQRHGIDFCCGGKRALGTVCDEQGLSFAQTVAAIEASVPAVADDRDWTTAPIVTLIDHIVKTYHAALRVDLPVLQALAARVAGVHGTRRANLTRIVETVDALSADLIQHMAREERVLFPAIRHALDKFDSTSLAAPITALEDDHGRAGALLEELRRLTDGYAPPEWGCATVHALYQGLEDLDRSIRVHVHLENNVLFPRALKCGLGPPRSLRHIPHNRAARS